MSKSTGFLVTPSQEILLGFTYPSLLVNSGEKK